MVLNMKKALSLILALCLLLVTAALGAAEASAGTGILPAIAGETGTTYVSLFDVIIYLLHIRFPGEIRHLLYTIPQGGIKRAARAADF